MTPVFLDANIQVYAAGSDHPLREPSRRILHIAASNPGAFVTDAEVIQELLHRYLALRIWPQGRESVREFAALMQGRIEPMYAGDVQQAARLADEHRDLSARDLVHAAVMSRLGVRQIVSADAGFDRIGAIERLDPALVDGWGASLPV